MEKLRPSNKFQYSVFRGGSPKRGQPIRRAEFPSLGREIQSENVAAWYLHIWGHAEIKHKIVSSQLFTEWRLRPEWTASVHICTYTWGWRAHLKRRTLLVFDEFCLQPSKYIPDPRTEKRVLSLSLEEIGFPNVASQNPGASCY